MSLSKKGKKSLKRYAKKRLRYKGRFVPKSLEKKVKNYRDYLVRTKGENQKYIPYQRLVNLYYKYRDLGLEEAKQFKSRKYKNLIEREKAEEVRYFNVMRMVDRIRNSIIGDPEAALYLKDWQANDYRKVDNSELRMEVDSFNNEVFDALETYYEQKGKDKDDISPLFTYDIQFFPYSESVFVDLNTLSNVEQGVIDILSDG